MIWTSWPVSIAIGLLVAGGLLLVGGRYRWPHVKPLALVVGIAAVLLAHYTVPWVSRARTVAKIERTEKDVTTLGAEMKAAAEKNAQLKERLRNYQATERKLSAEIDALKARDREHVRRRAELDQVVIPMPVPVASREQAMEVFLRYAR